jgi:hypothetical protein
LGDRGGFGVSQADREVKDGLRAFVERADSALERDVGGSALRIFASMAEVAALTRRSAAGAGMVRVT